jgi:phosphodiesterase/alkaline phosphatase D-like protein
MAGHLRTAPNASRDVRFLWSGDTVGQGWGINRDWGGLKMYETMRRAQPDVFVNLGDTIYADQPVSAEVRLDEGTVWKNVVTEAKSKVAQTIADFRGCHQYNLSDDNMRRFIAEVPQIVMWDDHEVRDNWYWERRQDADKRYEVKSSRCSPRAGARRSSSTTRCRSSATSRSGSIARFRSDRSSRSSRSTCAATRARTARIARRRSTRQPPSSVRRSWRG